MEASGLAENKTGRELRSSKNSELGFKYTIFVSQSGRSPGCRSRGGGKNHKGRHIFQYIIGCMQQPQQKGRLRYVNFIHI